MMMNIDQLNHAKGIIEERDTLRRALDKACARLADAGECPEDGQGGLFTDNEVLLLTNAVFRNNHAETSGGGIAIGAGTASISNTVFESNTAAQGGAGLWVTGGSGRNSYRCQLSLFDEKRVTLWRSWKSQEHKNTPPGCW